MGRPLSETNKIQPAGFAPEQLMAIDPTPLRGGTHTDRAIDQPKRPCSRCKREFQPTLTRRMLATPASPEAIAPPDWPPTRLRARGPLAAALLIEPGSATRPLASLNPNLIGRPVALRPLARTLFAPVTTGEPVLHAAVAVPDPGVEVLTVGFRHGVVFRQ